MTMKLSDWARQNGIDYKTAYRMFKAGTLPRRCEQLPTGTILVHEDDPLPSKVVLYARVSSNDQKEDLKRQMERLRSFAANRGLVISGEVEEIGSALNGKRRKLLGILSDPSISTIVVEHRDRLTRFAYESIEASLGASGRSVIVMNEVECKDDIVQDLIDVVTSLCAKMYGRRSAKNRAKRALEAIEE